MSKTFLLQTYFPQKGIYNILKGEIADDYICSPEESLKKV
jgi:hypothetical protein